MMVLVNYKDQNTLAQWLIEEILFCCRKIKGQWAKSVLPLLLMPDFGFGQKMARNTSITIAQCNIIIDVGITSSSFAFPLGVTWIAMQRSGGNKPLNPTHNDYLF